MTGENLIKLLHYNPETGVFTWLVKPNRRIPVGSKAGSINRQGYIKIKLNGVDYKAHRLAWLYMKDKWPEKGIDHIDNVKTHNWFSNLCEADQHQNMTNCGAHKNNTSGYKGVNFHSIACKWVAQIRFDGKRVHLGLFDTPESAFDAYCTAAKKHHGEFSNTSGGDKWVNID
ncbi:HNH endonuclease [Salmonella enterica]|nr:HNH endonuclease [Salmonella enterica]